MVAADGHAAIDGQQPGAHRLPVFAPGTLRAFQVAAAWAVAEEGARSVADPDLTALAGELLAEVDQRRKPGWNRC